MGGQQADQSALEHDEGPWDASRAQSCRRRARSVRTRRATLLLAARCGQAIVVVGLDAALRT